MRSLLIFLASAVLSAGVIANAVVQKKQFYPSVVYISKSNPSMAVSGETLRIFRHLIFSLFPFLAGNLLSIVNLSANVRKINEKGKRSTTLAGMSHPTDSICLSFRFSLELYGRQSSSI